ncbi:hypothetical protein OAU14_00170 [bacterium]|nr:hypothetical protein [bacterium]
MSEPSVETSLAVLHSKLLYPELSLNHISPHYSFLMENISSINQEQRLRYINAVISWFPKNYGVSFPKIKAKFGEDLEHRLGYSANSSTAGDILGLEMKAMYLVGKSGKKGTTSLRLTTKLSTEFSKLVQHVINTHFKQKTKKRYSTKQRIVYYNDYYKNKNQRELKTDQERRNAGYLLTSGEILKCGKENRLRRVKVDIDRDGVLIIYVKPPGYSKWYSRRIPEVRICDVFSKFTNGMLFAWGYPRKREAQRVLLPSYYVDVNPNTFERWFKSGKIGLEIRYGEGRYGKFDSSGDAMNMSRAEVEKMIFESFYSTPITSEFKLKTLK